jgi:hypothetical protein
MSSLQILKLLFTGRPTLEKCEAVKSERELKAEIESLSTENILPSNKRSTRSELPSEYTAEAIAEEVEVS